MSAAVRVRVPGKINLLLRVGPLRADGFHDLVTVFHAVDVLDEVEVRTAGELGIAVEGAGADVPVGPGNLAWRAAELLAAELGRPPDVHLTLRKSIPVAGGMAGGSADAAATLAGCAALWDAPRDLLEPVAARLGSDVPFALVGGTALGSGRGDRLAPVLATGELHWALAFAHGGIETAASYAELDRARPSAADPDPAHATALLDALRAGDARRLATALDNDLQSPAITLLPALRRTLDAGRDLGALGGIVSGSGPTCAFLCADADAAAALAAALAAEGVCRTTRVARGPVPGARVIG